MSSLYFDEDTVIVPPEELWEYMLKNKDELMDNPSLIYSMNNGYVELYAEIDGDDEETPYITVIVDKEELERLWISGEEDAEETYRDVLRAYSNCGGDVSRFQIEDTIREREDEIDVAFEDMLCTILEEAQIDTDMLEDIKNHTLKYIANQYPDRIIYRPMYVQDENGDECFEEYPYENWDIE